MPGQNRLADETSPYLRQHADNPVDWYPWGDEAFAEARRRDVPVLLSVGYSACHWCHVMAHESFEDTTVAAVMNERFVNIKVDREERPDVDSVYMDAIQAIAGEPNLLQWHAIALASLGRYSDAGPNRKNLCYCSFAYSALACFKRGMSGSASFQRVRKSLYAASARSRVLSASAPCEVFACKAFARATPRCANAPVQQFQTMPLLLSIF